MTGFPTFGRLLPGLLALWLGGSIGGAAFADDFVLPGLEADSGRFKDALQARYPAGGSDGQKAKAGVAVDRTTTRGDADAASVALSDLIGMGSADSGRWLALARAELGRAKPEPDHALQAAWQAQQGTDDAATKAAAFGVMADALLAQHRPSQAGEALEQAVQAAPEDAGYKTRLAAVNRQAGLLVRKVRSEPDAEPPRACIGFNVPPSRRNDFHAEDWVTLRPAVRDAAITHEGDEICVSGLPLASTTQATIRAGMPGESGLRLQKDAVVGLTLGDRAPLLAFDNTMFLLPRGQAARIVLTSTNVAAVKIRIAYFSERTIQPWTSDNRLGTAISGYVASQLSKESARIVWSGRTVIPHYARNVRQHVVLPLPQEAMQLPGLYAVAVTVDDGHEDGLQAVQPVLQTDLAPTVWRGADGLSVQLRRYSDANAAGGVHLRLLAHNNDILAETDTGADGFARFAAPLLAGTDQMAPATIQGTVALPGGGVDFVSLDLDSAAFDLSGRGTGGLPQPGPVDAYAWTDRGIYRPGETVQLMGLLRDPGGQSVRLPVRVRVRRPNGQVFLDASADRTGDASAHLAITLSNGAVAGMWTAELLTDPKLPPVGQVQFKVDAFVPDRMAVTLGTLPAMLVPGTPAQVPVQARFLYGAAAVGLSGSATVTLDVAKAPPAALAGYQIGLVDEQFAPAAIHVDLPATDAKGMSTLALSLAAAPDSTHPVQAHLDVVVNDPSGHGAHAHADLPVRAGGPLIGIRPDFTDSVDAGTEAGFDVAAVDADGHRVALPGHLTLVRERPDWRLVTRGTLSSYETVWRDEPIESRAVAVPAGGTLHVGRRLEFGRYRLEVAQADGLSASSVRFRSGWSESANPDVPDAADVSADKARYTAGDTARVHVAAPFAGPATLLVVTDRVLSARNVTLAADGSDFDVKVDAAWGPGAYVAVHGYRPGNGGRRPDRAIGLVWLAIDPAARHLATSFEAPALARPETTVHVRLHLQPGAWASVAAVDEGILRLTDYASPDPSAHFLGRRRLGIDIRDDWGHLIAPADGETAALSQGGDDGGNGKPNIPQTILSLFQPPVQADAKGDIDVPLVLPDFAGQVRLMAVGWNGTQLGAASADMLVRDRLVAEMLLPRFLAPGDSAQAAVLLQNLELPAGPVSWRVSADGPVAFDGPTSQSVVLAQGAQAVPTLTLRGTGTGMATLRLEVDGPGGFHARHEARLMLRSSRPLVTDVATAPLPPGGQASLAVPLAAYVPGSWRATASFGSAVRYDPGALLAALDAYPLFCLEQATSKGLPLTLAPAGLPGRAARLQALVEAVLDRQRYDGGFGLWTASDDAEAWLSAYATEFLLRAQHAGATVPDAALHDALQFQGQALDQTGDDPKLVASRAYALYVLALSGDVRIGRARILFEALDRLPTPLARAQLGAALAIGNDRPRADAAFAAAAAAQAGRRFWEYDYGDATRDAAALAVLMSENGVAAAVLQPVLQRLPGADLKPDELETQQQAWLAAAAYALGNAGAPVRVSIGGVAQTPASVVSVALSGPVSVRNDGDVAIWRSVSVSGVPVQAPAAARSGMTISRRFFTLDGQTLNLDQVKQNDEFVLLLEGGIDQADRAHQVALIQGLPAGWEISGRLGPDKVPGMGWLGALSTPRSLPAADDRYQAVMLLDGDTTKFRLAVRLRAVTIGRFAIPGAVLGDMYQPGLFARQGPATISVLAP